MTKELARRTLEEFLYNSDTIFGVSLPINDELILNEVIDGVFTQWTFKGLLKIAYDL